MSTEISDSEVLKKFLNSKEQHLTLVAGNPNRDASGSTFLVELGGTAPTTCALFIDTIQPGSNRRNPDLQRTASSFKRRESSILIEHVVIDARRRLRSGLLLDAAFRR